jgi:hypothetical protein
MAMDVGAKAPTHKPQLRTRADYVRPHLRLTESFYGLLRSFVLLLRRFLEFGDGPLGALLYGRV